MAIIRAYCEISSDMVDKLRNYGGGGGGDDLSMCQVWFLDGRTTLDPWAFVGVNPAVAFPNSTSNCTMLVYLEDTPGIHRIRPPIIPPLRKNGRS